MKFNKKILEILEKHQITEGDGLLALLSFKHNLSTTFVPFDLKLKLLSIGIVASDNGKYKWELDLFAEEDSAFAWVKDEYEPLFSSVHKDKGGNVKDCIVRMKKFFSENPSLRKDDVLDGVKLYLRRTDPMYIREARYFIFKGTGSQKTSDLHHWATIASETKEIKIPISDNNRIY